MKCPRCQANNRDGARFCRECGATFAAACSSCGAKVDAGSRFCDSCGTPLTTGGTPATTPSRFVSPETYTPKHLAERILTSKAALEGERKQVTVLFADLKGSMELLADRDPEEARKILDPVLELMMEAVHRYEGTVNQVMGDGIMALFGAPLAHEDHAVRACYAALRMQEAVKRYGDDVRRQEGVLPQIRVGLNSGEVVVRSIGSDLHMDYTAVGQTTHLAARMEQSAAPGTALISTDTLRLAEGYVQVTPLGPINVKGIAEAVQAYELTGAAAGRSRFQTLAARGLTKFVGRATEIEQLTAALGQARAGHGQVVAVVGEPGVGKSRLFWEFTHSHRTEGCLIVEAGSVSYGKATSYLPVIELLRAYFQIESRDDQRKIREKVTGKLFSLERALEPALPPLLALLDVPVEGEEWTRLDPPQRRQRTLDGVKRLLLREAQVQPLIVVFEDLHWIDGETQALVDGLVESLPAAKILLLVNYRPEYEHAWSAKTYYRLLRIDPLPVETAEELLDALLGASEELSPLKRLLIDRTQGNPFFLEESVRTLAEAGALSGDRGTYRLAKPLPTLQVPATAQAILAARIDRLSPEDKRVLQAAAVVGKDVPFQLLAAIAEMAEDELRQSLARLQAAEFLYETKIFPDLEHTFKHALTHDVAYGSLLQERRRALHVRIVQAIEAWSRERLDEPVEELAHHALKGEAWPQTLAYSRRAGLKALARSANLEAVTYFDQALGSLGHLPPSNELAEQAIDLRFELRTALWATGQMDRIRDALSEAERLATALNDRGRLGRVLAYMVHYLWRVGDYEDAIAVGQRAIAIATARGDFESQIVAHFHVGQVHWALGDYRAAMEVTRCVVDWLEGDQIRHRFGLPVVASVLARTWLVWSMAECGEFQQGIGRGEEEIRIAEMVNHPASLVDAYTGLGVILVRQGSFPRGVALLERACELAQLWDVRILWPAAAAPLGSAYVLMGRSADAVPLLEKAVERAEAMSMSFGHPMWVSWLAEGYVIAGRLNEALDHASRALALARRHRQRGHEAHALRVLGDIDARRDDFVRGEEHHARALALAEDLGMRPLVAHCHLGLAKLCRRTGKRIESDEHVATATTMYREMGMTYWLEKAEREMKESA